MANLHDLIKAVDNYEGEGKDELAVVAFDVVGHAKPLVEKFTLSVLKAAQASLTSAEAALGGSNDAEIDALRALAEEATRCVELAVEVIAGPTGRSFGESDE